MHSLIKLTKRAGIYFLIAVAVLLIVKVIRRTFFPKTEDASNSESFATYCFHWPPAAYCFQFKNSGTPDSNYTPAPEILNRSSINQFKPYFAQERAKLCRT